MFKISIPKPCLESWENMTPDGISRHCNSCAKTVVDFSLLSDEVVQQYFISNYGNSICGRFKNTQLQRIIIDLPKKKLRIQLPFWKIFLVAFLICFGATFFSIDTTMAGVPFTQGDTAYYASKKIMDAKGDKKNPGHYRKRKRRKQTTVILSEDWKDIIFDGPTITTTMGMGIVYTPPEPPIMITVNSHRFDSININEDTGTVAKNNSDPDKPAKTPPTKTPDSHTAFILPAAVVPRNLFTKKKKN